MTSKWSSAVPHYVHYYYYSHNCYGSLYYSYVAVLEHNGIRHVFYYRLMRCPGLCFP